MSRSIVRVLIVEDQPSWQKALRDLFERVFGARGEVVCCTDPEDAINRLRQRDYDLLSLDIALGDHKDVAANGLDVFDKAVQESPPLVNGVIVISGARFDRQLKRAIPDQGRREIVEIELQPYLERWYPGRVRMYEKHPGSSCEVVISRIERTLSDIAEVLAKPPEAYAFDDDAGIITRLHNRGLYRVSPRSYPLLKKLSQMQHETGDQISNTDLYEAVVPKQKRVYCAAGKLDLNEVREYIASRLKGSSENIRFRKDCVIRDRGYISLRIP